MSFMELGRKLDNGLRTIKYTLYGINTHTPWYRTYVYFYCKRKNDPELTDILYELNRLYKWQYRRLQKINEVKIGRKENI